MTTSMTPRHGAAGRRHDTHGGARGPHAARPDGVAVADFTEHLIERALRERVRYRYVHPRVARAPEGYRIESPCCSRNVAADGGVIDIAWLARGADDLWHLHARDHARRRWVEQCASVDLNMLLDVLCTDAVRVFWP